MTSITLDGLSKHYGPVAAVDDLSLTVDEGEFVTILGPSGSGKTTVLSLIAGLVSPSSGAIRLGDRDVTTLPPARRNIGLVFQSYALFPHLTVRSNIAFPLAVRKTPAAEIDRRVKHAIALLRLSGLEERRPSQLSGGQQQRVALARALVFQPDILLLDEPLAALDRKLRGDVQVELRRLQRTFGTTTLLVTRDQEEALSLSDRVLVMESGRLQQLGTPKDLYLRPQNTFVAGFLGITNLLHGAVRYEGGRCVLMLENGVTMPMPPGPFRRDENVRVVVRPERAQLVPRSSERRGLPGRIGDAIYLGQTVRYHVDIGLERPFVAGVTDGRMVLSVGDEVLITWDEQNIWPLPKSSAQSVPESRSEEAAARVEKAMLNRREALELGACFALTAGIMQPRRAGAQPAPAKEIRIIAAGGQSGESVQVGYINPFTARTGIKVVREDTTGTPLGKLRAMVESGRIDAVLHEIGGSALAQATALGLVEPLDWAKIDPAPIFPEARHTHGLGYQYFSVILARRAQGAAIADWRDFWDAKKFPGKRSLPDIPYYSARRRRGAGCPLTLVVIPFWISVLIRTYAWIILLGNAGIVNQGLLAAGLVGSPVTFLYNKVGVIIGMVNVLLPFLVLPLFVAMLKLDTRLLHAARSLGASDFAVFWRVFFPLTIPALVAGSLLAFIMGLGFYVTPMILGGGRVPMLVNMLDLLINRMPNWPLASAISVLLLAVTLALYAVSRRVGGQSLF